MPLANHHEAILVLADLTHLLLLLLQLLHLLQLAEFLSKIFRNLECFGASSLWVLGFRYI